MTRVSIVVDPEVGLVVQHPQDRLRCRALVVVAPPSIVVFVVPGEEEEVPCPPLLILLLLLLLPAVGHGGRSGKVEGRGPVWNPGNVPTTTNASKRCRLQSGKTGEGRGEGLHGMDGWEGAAIMTNPSLLW